MSAVLSSRTAFRDTSDPRHNKVYLPVLCALHEWPLSQMSSIVGTMRPLSALSCCKWRVTLDTGVDLPVLCDHLLECISVLQGRCSGQSSGTLEAVLPKVTLVLCSWVCLSCRAAPVALSWANNLYECYFMNSRKPTRPVPCEYWFYTTASWKSCSVRSLFELLWVLVLGLNTLGTRDSSFCCIDVSGKYRWSPNMVVFLWSLVLVCCWQLPFHTIRAERSF